MKHQIHQTWAILLLTSGFALSGCELTISGLNGTATGTSTATGTGTGTGTATSTRTSTSTSTSTLTNTSTQTSTGTVAGAVAEVRVISGATVTGAQNADFNLTYNFSGKGIKKAYKVFVHFLNSNGDMVSMQDDHDPVPATNKWNGAVSYSRKVHIPAGIPVGNYSISVGLFDPDDWSVEARPKLSPASGVIELGKEMDLREYSVGTLKVTKGVNLPELPSVPPLVDGPQGPKPGVLAGDPITNSAGYGDDYHPSAYRLTFHDEFNANTLNASTWINTYAWGERTLGGNAEEECYLERNVSQGRGELALTAKRETVICPKVLQTMNYTSGMINSMNSFTQKYGYFVMRAKLPKGQGLWPAFWLMPQSGDWPPELDIFEVLGHDMNTIHNTYHWKDGKGDHQMDSKAFATVDMSADYHVYAVDWQAGSIKWYIDGRLLYSHTGSDVYSQPMYILANLAVGGGWPGSPDSTTPFPSEMAIDYIRVYGK